LLARVLAGEPKWLLADEPLAGLDPGLQLDVTGLFRQMASEGCGVIVTLHDLHMALRISDRVLILAEGRILADDKPVQALSPAILAQAYGVQTRFWDGEAGPMIEIVGRRG
jgi:iron complex transport system ATP-binding protein